MKSELFHEETTLENEEIYQEEQEGVIYQEGSTQEIYHQETSQDMYDQVEITSEMFNSVDAERHCYENEESGNSGTHNVSTEETLIQEDANFYEENNGQGEYFIFVLIH